jgi:hypothetical protein
MEKLIGKWALESSDKFDDFLKELGKRERENLLKLFPILSQSNEKIQIN